MASLKPIHNQTVVLGALMGIELPPFVWDESPLPLIFEAKHQEEVTEFLHERNWLHPEHIYRVPASNGGKAGGKASAAVAGEYSDELGRDRMTMPERGHESVRLAGTYSDELGRDRMTMPERGHESARLAGTFSEKLGRERLTLPECGGRAEVWLVFQHRASTAWPWGPWMGARCEYSDGYLDGISRHALASGACQMSWHGHNGAAACAI